jgi:four helix bundle protein
MMSFNENIRIRTKKFALNCIKYAEKLNKSDINRIIINQFIKSSTSLAANFRAACRARSKAEYYSKLCIVVEETDETLFWLEILVEISNTDLKENKLLQNEAIELLSIFAKTRKNLKQKSKSKI